MVGGAALFVPALPEILIPIAGVVYLVCWNVANALTGRVTDLFRAQLTERRLQARRHAREWGWLLLVAGALIAIIVLTVAVNLGEGARAWVLERAALVVALCVLPGISAPAFWMSLRDPHTLRGLNELSKDAAIQRG